METGTQNADRPALFPQSPLIRWPVLLRPADLSHDVMCASIQFNSSGLWFALYVAPRHEKVVDRQLNQIGYETFLPLYRSRRKWSDRVKTVDLPLFPGYLFCRLDPASPLKVVSLPSVWQVVRGGPNGGALTSEEIDAVRRITELGRSVEPFNDLAVGEQVRVESGPLAGIRGVLVGFRGSSRLVVSVEQIQRSVMVEVDRADVLPVRLPPRRERGTLLERGGRTLRA